MLKGSITNMMLYGSVTNNMQDDCITITQAVPYYYYYYYCNGMVGGMLF